jgi:hypothetical protein
VLVLLLVRAASPLLTQLGLLLLRYCCSRPLAWRLLLQLLLLGLLLLGLLLLLLLLLRLALRL